jgi:ATP-binding cassette, subfamily B, multidrug efflux pump
VTDRSRPASTAPQDRPSAHRGGPGAHLMGEKVRARNTSGTLMRLWRYLRRERGPLALASLLVIGSTGLQLLGPLLIGIAIDDYIVPGDMAGLARISALLFGTYLVASGLMWLQAYILAGAAQRTIRHIRADLFRKVQTLPLRFFDQRTHGDLMSRLTNDVENISQVMTESTTQIVAGVLTAIGVIVLMFVLNPLLAVTSVTTILVMTYVINRFIAARTRPGFREQQAALGALNGIIEETISGQRVVKAYHREETVISEFAAANAVYRKHATRTQTLAGFVGPLMNFVSNSGLAIIAGFGGWMVLQGMTTVGMIATFINYARQLGRPINEIANLYNQIQQALAGAERVFEVIDEEPERDAEGAEALERIVGHVEFDRVSFSYDTGTPVLRTVDLEAQPGETVALVGPTGAGKTTVINLLTNFYDIDSGAIRIDGREIQSIRKEDLRRQLGMVLQDTFLFSGTIADNIRYGRLEATDEEVREAARLANADGFIMQLPEAYATPLQERGNNLSQGQRQLLAIARAILSDPAILILDEATSSVDTRTERHIQGAMLRLMKGRTSFVIAHRLSTIREADQILVIVDGEIIERGTHEQLIERRGFYQKLQDGQFAAGGGGAMSIDEAADAIRQEVGVGE